MPAHIPAARALRILTPTTCKAVGWKEAEEKCVAQRMATRSPRTQSQSSRVAWAHQGRRAPEHCGSRLNSRTTPRSQREEGGDPRPTTSPVPFLAWYSRWLHDHRLRAIQTRAQDVGLRPEQSWREKKTADSGRGDSDSVCGEPGGDAASLSVRPPGAFQTGQSVAACGEGAGPREHRRSQPGLLSP